MERAHIHRLWRVAEDLFEVEHKPLAAFLVLHLLLVHRPVRHAPTTSRSHARPGYVTDMIFASDAVTADEEEEESRKMSASSSSTTSAGPVPTHDVARPALPPYLKREEALTRIRAAEMLLYPSSSSSPPVATSTPNDSTASVCQGRELTDGLSKRAAHEVFVLVDQVLAPLLLFDSRSSGDGGRATSATGATRASTLGGLGDVAEAVLNDAATSSRSNSAVVTPLARVANAEYVFGPSTIVGLAWPADAFALPLPDAPTTAALATVTSISVKPALSLPVIPVAVVVRAHILAARTAQRMRRLRRALALLHMAERWVKELLGCDNDASVDDGRLPCVSALRHELLARLDEEARDRLMHALAHPRTNTPADVDGLDALLTQWVKVERWCCLRLLHAELCHVYHALIGTVHAAPLLQFNGPPPPRVSGSNPTASAADGTARGMPRQGLTSASLRAVATGINSSSGGDGGGGAGRLATSGAGRTPYRAVGDFSTAGPPARRATLATLDVKTRMKEYSAYVTQLVYYARPPPRLATLVDSTGDESAYFRSLSSAWSAVLTDCFISDELRFLGSPSASLSGDKCEVGPLEKATDMVLTHFDALSLVLRRYYDASSGHSQHGRQVGTEEVPDEYNRNDDTDVANSAERLFLPRHQHRHRSLAHILACYTDHSRSPLKRVRDDSHDNGSHDDAQTEAREGAAADAAHIASEYELLYELVLLGFDGSLTRWEQWCTPYRSGAVGTATERRAEGSMEVVAHPHWLSAGVRTVLAQLLHLYATVHCPAEEDTSVARIHSSGGAAPVEDAVHRELRIVLRGIDHEMLALSGRQEEAPSTPPPFVCTTRRLTEQLPASRDTTPRGSPHVVVQKASPFHQVRLLILMKASALMLAASSEMQQLALVAALDHLVNAQSFLVVLYRHVQHVASCRVDMHILVACLALQLQLRDISAAVLDEALAGQPLTASSAPGPTNAPSSSASEGGGGGVVPLSAPTFLSQLRGGYFSDAATVSQALDGPTVASLSSWARSTAYEPVSMADVLHDVGLPLCHLIAAERAAQEGLLYTHPATRLLVRLLQAFAVYQGSTHNACRLELTPHAGSSGSASAAAAVSWRPLAASQRQRCAAALGAMLAPLIVSLEDCDQSREEADEDAVSARTRTPPQDGAGADSDAPAAWTPANRVLCLLLRGLWLLTDERDELAARRVFKQAAQIAKRHMGMLDALTADTLQWLAASTKLTESFSDSADEGRTRTAQYELVATQVAVRCSAAALWRLGDGVGECAATAASHTPQGCEGVMGSAEATEGNAGLDGARLSSTVCARWEAAVRDVCGAGTKPPASASQAGGGATEAMDPALYIHKRRKLLVAAMTFLPGTSSYARLS